MRQHFFKSIRMAAKEVDAEENMVFEQAEKILQEILDNPVKYTGLDILVCGQTGVGKSALVNSLVGHYLCPAGDPGKRCANGAFKSETRTMTKVKGNINGTIVTIWDSPGLQDDTVDEEQYLQDMYDKCRDVNLVLYCVEMTTVRWTDQDKRAVTLLTGKFGKDFWKKCVLVLTKANMVHVPRENRPDKRAYHERLYANFIHKFRQQPGIKEISKSSLTAVAVGIVEGDYDDKDDQAYNDRHLWYVSERSSSSEREDFIAELWVTVFEVLKHDKHAQSNLVNITGPSRIEFVLMEDTKTFDSKALKTTLQHGASAQAQRQHQDLPSGIMDKMKRLEELNVDVSQPERDEHLNFKIKPAQMERMKKSAYMDVFINCLTIGEIIGVGCGIIGGPIGMFLGGAIGSVVGAYVGITAVGVMKVASLLSSFI